MWGLGVAIAIAPVWRRPAPPDQLAGYMKSQGLDAYLVAYEIASLIIFPVVASLLSWAAIRHLERPPTRRWAVHGSAAALLLGFWGAFILPPPVHVIVIAPVLAVAAMVGLRGLRARFSRQDLILLPVWMTLFFGLTDLWRDFGYVQNVWLAAAILMALRLSLCRFVPEEFSPANLFLASPLGSLFLIRELGLSQQLRGGLAVAVAVLSPLVVLWLRPSEQRARRIVSLVTYPLVVLSYFHVVNIASAEGFQRASLFEEGHGLMPANEMLRGEVLYRDITPGHGAISDGVLDYLALRFSGETLGNAMNVRAIVGSLTPLAIYAVALAATGLPELGLLGFLLTVAYIRSPLLAVRPAPALFALAFMIAAVRLRRRGYFFWAGVMLVVALMTSIDYAFVSAMTLFVAVLVFSRSWRERGRAARTTLLGLGAAMLPVLIILLAYGVFAAFFRVTFYEVLTLGPAYNIGGVLLPDTFKDLQSFPEALSLVFEPKASSYVLWCVAAVMIAAMFAANRFLLSRRLAGLFLSGCWVLASSLSYVERHHRYFNFVLPAFLIAGVFLLWRWRASWARTLAVVGTAALLIMAQPTPNLTVASIIRISNTPFDPDFAEYDRLPRARGALLRKSDFAKLDAARGFVETLAPNETYFDFANLPLLYFLLDKPCPIRQYEVPFLQPEQLQREVVLRLDHDRSVQAALISFPLVTNRIDAVPNSQRAPLVWRYLEAQFEPAFEQEGVVFWRRKK